MELSGTSSMVGTLLPHNTCQTFLQTTAGASCLDLYGPENVDCHHRDLEDYGVDTVRI
jgi:hypothetical protein